MTKILFQDNWNNTVQHGSESIFYFGPKIWKMFPQGIQECESILELKPYQDVGLRLFSYEFFCCNFYKYENFLLKLSDL